MDHRPIFAALLALTLPFAAPAAPRDLTRGVLALAQELGDPETKQMVKTLAGRGFFLLLETRLAPPAEPTESERQRAEAAAAALIGRKYAYLSGWRTKALGLSRDPTAPVVIRCAFEARRVSNFTDGPIGAYLESKTRKVWVLFNSETGETSLRD